MTHLGVENRPAKMHLGATVLSCPKLADSSGSAFFGETFRQRTFKAAWWKSHDK
jgi:hypothetical protein